MKFIKQITKCTTYIKKKNMRHTCWNEYKKRTFNFKWATEYIDKQHMSPKNGTKALLYTPQRAAGKAPKLTPSRPENRVFPKSLRGDSDDSGGCNLRDFLATSGFGERAEAALNLGADDLSDANSFFYLQTHTRNGGDVCTPACLCRVIVGGQQWHLTRPPPPERFGVSGWLEVDKGWVWRW